MSVNQIILFTLVTVVQCVLGSEYNQYMEASILGDQYLQITFRFPLDPQRTEAAVRQHFITKIFPKYFTFKGDVMKVNKRLEFEVTNEDTPKHTNTIRLPKDVVVQRMELENIGSKTNRSTNDFLNR